MSQRISYGCLLGAALMLIVGSISSVSASELAVPDTNLPAPAQTVQIIDQQEEAAKRADPFYSKQAATQAAYYRQLAAGVAKSGGNPQALLSAAAYFESEAKK